MNTIAPLKSNLEYNFDEEIDWVFNMLHPTRYWMSIRNQVNA